MDEIRERLDQIGADLKSNTESQTEVLKSIKALTSSLEASRKVTKPAKKPQEPQEVQRAQSLQEPRRAQSLQELESKMFEEFMASHHLRGKLDNHPCMPSDADISSPIEQGERIRPPTTSPKSLVSVLPGDLKSNDTPDPIHLETMPGVPEKSSSPMSATNREAMAFEKRSKTLSMTRRSSTTKLRHMNAESHTNILGSLSINSLACSVLSGPLQLDVGSKIILAMPRFLCFPIGFLILCESVLAVACGPIQCPSDAGLRPTVIESITYGIAAVFATTSLKKALEGSNLTLAIRHLLCLVSDVHSDWVSVSSKEGCKHVAVWLMMVLILLTTRCLGTLHRLNDKSFVFDLTHEIMLNSTEVLSMLTYFVSSALVTAAAYAQSHLLLGLDKALDCWCSAILEQPDFREGVQSWNALQALLKSIGRELADAFLILQVFGSLCFMFFLVNSVILVFEDLGAIDWAVEVFSGTPLLFMSWLMLKVSAHGAALTEKCRNIPPFVNQIPTQEVIDEERQYLVQFITDSSAGFCVRDVKLTQEMVLKQIYIIGALLSATISALSRYLI